MKAKTETPLMRQYRQIKEKHPDTILLYRLGDFYETFGDDAIATAKACGITLTKRNNGAAGDIPLAGFPHHQLDAYLPKLVRGGHRVAVCEQLEDPKQAKGIVRRGVVEIVTPGIVMYDRLLETKAHTYVAALSLAKNKANLCGLAVTDVSTGTFMVGEIGRRQLAAMVESLNPAEIVVNKKESADWELLLKEIECAPSVTRLEDWLFELEFSTNNLQRHFQTASLKGFGAGEMQVGLLAAGALLQYVSDTQKKALSQITTMSLLNTADVMMLDAATRRNLEISASLHSSNREGALVGVLDQTQTPMGGRMLRWWIQQPLINTARIEKRQGVVRGFVRDMSRLHAVRDVLKDVGDLERLLARVFARKASSRDVAAIRSGLKVLPTLVSVLQLSVHKEVSILAARVQDYSALTDYLDAAMVEEPSIHVGIGGIFRQGFDAELDGYQDALVNGKDWINTYQTNQRIATGIHTLKVGFNNVFGYYIEVTKVQAGKVPDQYQRKQTLANAERYTTSELQEIEQKLMTAEQKTSERELLLLEDVFQRIATEGQRIQQTCIAVADIDSLVSFALVAINNNYVEPVLHDGTKLEISEARHPVIEHLLPPGTSYVSNSVMLDNEAEQILIITGPNMSGKSSYLRQVGLIVFMAHLGSYVPAKEALIPLTDRIFTRVGAHDNIMAGESTFLVEMLESANILNNATEKSLILLDEVGRGTATFDGISIAWAVAEYLHQKIGAKTLFATHYHELTLLASQFERIKNLRVEVQEVGNNIVFTHKVVPGFTDHSFGIHVARMAGMPHAVLETAQHVLIQLETGSHTVSNKAEVPSDGSSEEMHSNIVRTQITMFDMAAEEFRAKMREIDVDNLTPVQALKILAELKEDVSVR